jgi:hypothetical protein
VAVREIQPSELAGEGERPGPPLVETIDRILELDSAVVFADGSDLA